MPVIALSGVLISWDILAMKRDLNSFAYRLHALPFQVKLDLFSWDLLSQFRNPEKDTLKQRRLKLQQ